MADNVQWIKLKVGMFDGNSFKKIKRARIGGVSYRDKLTAIWFELLDLAGKSNANGCLIDNNEIAYHTFEDIACMLDREEKEIELCMQFFINEKMVEIVDDVYCLTNFMMYQNQDGLEKIREQRRIAQSKWRERKKLGLIGQNVDENTSTVESTHHLPSISISNSTSNSKSISSYRKEKKEKKQIIPSSLDEVIEYARERGREELAKDFYEFYSASNWIDYYGNKILNWKQKFITYENKHPSQNKPKFELTESEKALSKKLKEDERRAEEEILEFTPQMEANFRKMGYSEEQIKALKEMK